MAFDGSTRLRRPMLLAVAVVLPLLGALPLPTKAAETGADLAASRLSQGARNLPAYGEDPADVAKDEPGDDADRDEGRPDEFSGSAEGSSGIDAFKPMGDRLQAIRRAAGAALYPVKSGKVSMAGEATVRVAPDAAAFRFGVVSEAVSASDAMKANAAAATALRDALVKAGVATDEATTEQIVLETVPSSDEDRKPKASDGARLPPPARYRARNVVLVEIRRLPERSQTFLGELMMRAVEAGANDISGPDLKVVDDAKPLANARKAAVDDALVKAATYAHALGAKVGRIVEIRESGLTGDPVVAQAMRLGAAPPVSLGSREITARVTVVWEIDQSVP